MMSDMAWELWRAVNVPMVAGLFLPLQMQEEGSQMHELGQEEWWGYGRAPR